MFNFNKKNSATKVVDNIYTSAEAKTAALLELAKTSPETLFIFWFDESQQEVETAFSAAGVVSDFFQAREITSHHTTGKKIIFAEHYPLRKKEEELYQQLHLDTAIVYSSLTEPIFKKFGGDRIIELVKALGMDEHSAIEHKMISKAITNAQEKLEKKLTIDQSSHSAAGWFEKNFPG